MSVEQLQLKIQKCASQIQSIIPQTSKPFLYLNRVFKVLLEKCNFLLAQYFDQIHKVPHSLKKKSKAIELFYTLALAELINYLDNQSDRSFNQSVKIGLQLVHDWKIEFEKEVQKQEKSERPQSFQHFGDYFSSKKLEKTETQGFKLFEEIKQPKPSEEKNISIGYQQKETEHTKKYERVEGEILTDEYGVTKFWGAQNLVEKQKAHLIHPQSDLGHNKTYYFGGPPIENKAANFTPHQLSLKPFQTTGDIVDEILGSFLIQQPISFQTKSQVEVIDLSHMEAIQKKSKKKKKSSVSSTNRPTPQLRPSSLRGTPQQKKYPEVSEYPNEKTFLKFKQFEKQVFEEELARNETELPIVNNEINKMKLRLASERITVRQPDGIIQCLSLIEHPQPLDIKQPRKYPGLRETLMTNPFKSPKQRSRQLNQF